MSGHNKRLLTIIYNCLNFFFFIPDVLQLKRTGWRCLMAKKTIIKKGSVNIKERKYKNTHAELTRKLQAELESDLIRYINNKSTLAQNCLANIYHFACV